MWNKAERGEILNHPPIGYVRSAKAREGAGDYVLDPDEQVQSVMHLIFAQFQRRGSINSLLRWLVREDVKIPVRPLSGPERGELQWRRPNRVTLLNMLHHPIYAGAYANVQKESTSGSLRYSCQREAIDYGGDRCQSLSGKVLETFVIARLLQAVSPASLELSLAASADIECEREQLAKHWQQRLTRSRYEAEQARRQYAAVDPDHRLVARELERQWDEALRADEQLKADHAQFLKDRPQRLSDHEQEQIRGLSEVLPQLWHSSSTTPQDRQSIARLLLEEVRVMIEGESERVDVELRWAGGFVSRHALRRPVQTYEQLSNYDDLMARIKSRLAEGKTLAAIAAQLNAEGFQPPKRSPKFSAGILTRFLRERGIRIGRLPKSVTEKNLLERNEWWLADLAKNLSMPIATLHRWQRVGWVTSRKIAAAGNRWAIFADDEELARLRSLRESPRSWPNPYPPELTTPKPKPRLSQR
jgi:hypothetical protein